MLQKIKFKNKTFFEIETKGGIKYLLKEDRDASRLAGKPVYIRKPLNEILNSDKEVINLK